MTVAISISSKPEGIWKTSAENYREIVELLRQRNPNESVVVQHLTMAGFFGGISLDREWEESPELTERIVRLLIETLRAAKENYEPSAENEPSTSFTELLQMLERFQTERINVE